MTTTGRRLAAGAIAALYILAGCTTQVNNTALNMQESYKTLLKKQILYNLGEADRDGAAFFPSQIIVSAGTAESSNSISPTLSIPLPGVTTVAGYASTSFSGSTSVNWGAPGLSLGVSDAWKLNWGLTPRNDPDELSRLRALYRVATGRIDEPCNDAGAQTWLRKNYVIQGGRLTPNPAFTQEPNCILCKDKPGYAESQETLTKNTLLKCGFISTSPKEGFIAFERYGSTQFYVDAKTGPQDFLQFTFFILEAMSNAAYAQYNVIHKDGPAILSKEGQPTFIPGPLPPKVQSVTPFSMPL